jgi:hypothetical protein
MYHTSRHQKEHRNGSQCSQILAIGILMAWSFCVTPLLAEEIPMSDQDRLIISYADGVPGARRVNHLPPGSVEAAVTLVYPGILAVGGMSGTTFGTGNATLTNKVNKLVDLIDQPLPQTKPGAVPNFDNPQDQFRYALAVWVEGTVPGKDPKPVVAAFQSVVQQFPKEVRLGALASLWAGYVQFKAKSYQAAQKEYQNVLKRFPTQSDAVLTAQWYIAVSAQDANELDTARITFQKIVETGDRYPERAALVNQAQSNLKAISN